MSLASPAEPLDKLEVARAMGLVVALRFLVWGSSVAWLTGFALLQSGRFPSLLQYLALPMMLAIYLMGTGHVLLLLRLQGAVAKVLALVPLLAVALLGKAGVTAGSPGISAVFGLSLVAYLQACARQALELHHTRAYRWFGLTSRAALGVVCLALLWSGAASAVTVMGGLALALATALGWQIWLAELRDSLARL